MDDTLVDTREVVPAPADLALLVVRVQAEVDQLRAEVVQLRRENLELRQQVGYWRSRHADAVRRNDALAQQVKQLQGEIRKLQAERFGRRSEKQSRSDRSNDLDDAEHPKPQRPRGRQPGQPA